MAPSEEPAVNQHAATLLRRHGQLVSRIVRVDPDAVLYLNGAGLPMTAWLRAKEGSLGPHLAPVCEPGFAAERPTHAC